MTTFFKNILCSTTSLIALTFVIISCDEQKRVSTQNTTVPVRTNNCDNCTVLTPGVRSLALDFTTFRKEAAVSPKVSPKISTQETKNNSSQAEQAVLPEERAHLLSTRSDANHYPYHIIVRQLPLSVHENLTATQQSLSKLNITNGDSNLQIDRYGVDHLDGNAIPLTIHLKSGFYEPIVEVEVIRTHDTRTTARTIVWLNDDNLTIPINAATTLASHMLTANGVVRVSTKTLSNFYTIASRAINVELLSIDKLSETTAAENTDLLNDVYHEMVLAINRDKSLTERLEEDRSNHSKALLSEWKQSDPNQVIPEQLTHFEDGGIIFNHEGDASPSTETSLTIDYPMNSATYTLNLSIKTISLIEGSSATIAATITPTLKANEKVDATLTTSSLTATSGSDFTASTKNLTWYGGLSQTLSFTVTSLDDLEEEVDETFLVSVDTLTGATIGTADLTVSIAANDQTPDICSSNLCWKRVSIDDFAPPTPCTELESIFQLPYLGTKRWGKSCTAADEPKFGSTFLVDKQCQQWQCLAAGS